MVNFILENADFSIAFNTQNGGIEAVHNRRASLNLISSVPTQPPWRMEVDGTWTSEFVDFSAEAASDKSLTLRWRTAAGLIVESQVELIEGGVQFRVQVINPTQAAIDKIEYPIFGGIGQLDQTANGYLLHPQGTGFLFENPDSLFEIAEGSRRGLRYSPYPEGFSGSSTQMMAYYAEDKGGFYFAAYDATKAMKWLNFYKTDAGSLECTFMHQSPNVAASEAFKIPYPIELSILVEGNWYEAAERYKAWATQQSWTAQGTLHERALAGRKLPTDDAGITTFGINAAYDRSAWLDYFHQIAGTPVFHTLGVNWPHYGGDYHNHLPGGREDWFPARFNVANLATIRRNGDTWAPFEFDLLLSHELERPENEQIKATLLTLPEKKYSFDAYAFPFLCPVTDYLQDIHRWRDETLVRDYHPDGVYYDISLNNVVMMCRNPEHGHPVGGGGWMVDAYSHMFVDTKAAMNQAAGHSIAQGTEMINEVFIPVIDFYQARAEASPLASFEGDFFRDWIIAGKAEKVPLFTYIYHEYGPVRMDGWSKLSVEVGDLFYWVASRVTLWGGLFEINGEFSPLESLDGREDLSEEHYYQFENRSYKVDPAKAAFVKEVAAARVGFAKDYLVYGTMQRPLSLDVPSLSLNFFLYNAPTGIPHYGQKGVKSVPQVIHAAWRSPEGKLGLLFTNLHESDSIQLPLDLSLYGLTDKNAIQIEQITSSERTALNLGADIVLPPRRIVLIEITESIS